MVMLKIYGFHLVQYGLQIFLCITGRERLFKFNFSKASRFCSLIKKNKIDRHNKQLKMISINLCFILVEVQYISGSTICYSEIKSQIQFLLSLLFAVLEVCIYINIKAEFLQTCKLFCHFYLQTCPVQLLFPNFCQIFLNFSEILLNY